jgi:hypothetical protein
LARKWHCCLNLKAFVVIIKKIGRKIVALGKSMQMEAKPIVCMCVCVCVGAERERERDLWLALAAPKGPCVKDLVLAGDIAQCSSACLTSARPLPFSSWDWSLNSGLCTCKAGAHRAGTLLL